MYNYMYIYIYTSMIYDIYIYINIYDIYIYTYMIFYMYLLVGSVQSRLIFCCKCPLCISVKTPSSSSTHYKYESRI